MKYLFKSIRKYFVPHKENAWKPHLLRDRSILGFFVLIIIVQAGLLFQILFVFDKTNFLASVLPGVLTMLTNEQRAENNLPALREDATLDKAATMKAEDMAKRGYFAHVNPDGEQPWYYFDQAGYDYSAAGENLAVNFFDSKDVATAWMNSPTHRANIVKPDFIDIGIGVASGVYEGKNTVFVVQMFGKPANLKKATASTINSTDIKNDTTKIKNKTKDSKVSTSVSLKPTDTKVLGEITEKKTNEKSNFVSNIKQLSTSPKYMSSYIYGIIAFILLLVVLLMVFIRSEKKHHGLVIQGIFLFFIILLLLLLNLKALGITKIGTADSVNSNIAY